MVRLLFRLLSLAALSVSVIMAVLDATRTVGESSLQTTPLLDSWTAASPRTIDWLRDAVTADVHPLAWDPLLLAILHLPGFVVFGALAFLFHALGHRPARHADGFMH
ncbi:MAG: hypothetical protein KF914_03885 [Rhizobiaceae bacterium]|nr:hypothetical protein [Rhizobiaceae bacterium]